MRNSIVETSVEIHPVPSSPQASTGKVLKPILVKSGSLRHSSHTSTGQTLQASQAGRDSVAIDRHQQTEETNASIINVPALKLDRGSSSSPSCIDPLKHLANSEQGLNQVLPWLDRPDKRHSI